MVTIIDYGVGNLSSIHNMLGRLGVTSIVTSSPEEIQLAEKLILPGVGAYDTCCDKLYSSRLVELLEQRILVDKVPVLGICVGMQLLMQGSEEGTMPGLGWVKGKVVKFEKSRLSSDLKIPHMGWTSVRLNKSSKLFDDMYDDPRFYFVHSYHALLDDEREVLLQATHGYQFAAGIEKNNIMGVQFHPEKSHKFGMKLLSNFVKNY